MGLGKQKRAGVAVHAIATAVQNPDVQRCVLAGDGGTLGNHVLWYWPKNGRLPNRDSGQ